MEIKITPEELDRIAGNFIKAAGEAQQQINNLGNDIGNLNGQWSGSTQAKFNANFNEAKQEMNKYIPILQHISDELKKIATNFRNVDNSY
ncbi:WXG100 family type VII secretion target [Bacillus cereus]|uniref:WXG100 family type VII secretion target n=1 Tax=Bacillus arachidis TaxID=2819290 RepID=A0ABS3P655_9BACI|nr:MULTISPECIES: WXG100 family type VII secretion target [Bacillus]PGX92007.1 WXG100 family type VII secretion target [Bacillus cereus]MBO1628290.1 WXG100 family type VII secretion target [Bacillus arachidis]PFD97150.1 WXG100 family type VII secretion target [Bacillus sp. AFS023182]WIY63151.1 WXG100 family type VII secretion target [Bacillus arachidis]SDY78257.1 WXG100 family type VII secretion target [Bacillus sp. 166amftsu]